MEIERQWGKAPGWFLTLEPETRSRLFAWWNIGQSARGTT